MKQSEKPMLPAKAVHDTKSYTACSASPFCRYPGRMWVPGLEKNQRLCVEHYSRDPRRFEKTPQEQR
jgi:hypothetical protein